VIGSHLCTLSHPVFGKDPRNVSQFHGLHDFGFQVFS
jgi:hypothetical protein